MFHAITYASGVGRHALECGEEGVPLGSAAGSSVQTFERLGRSHFN